MMRMAQASPYSPAFWPTLWLHRWLLGLIFACFSAPSLAQSPSDDLNAPSISIYRLQPIIEQDTLYLNAQTRFKLPNRVKQAVLHEIPLNFVIQLEVRSRKSLLGLDFSDTLYQLQFQTTLSYYNFNQKFILLNQRNKKVKLFDSLQQALETLGTFEHFAVMPVDQFTTTQPTEVRLRIYLDRWQLPAPLTLEALYLSDWSLDSGWVSRSIDLPLKGL